MRIHYLQHFPFEGLGSAVVTKKKIRGLQSDALNKHI